MQTDNKYVYFRCLYTGTLSHTLAQINRYQVREFLESNFSKHQYSADAIDFTTGTVRGSYDDKYWVYPIRFDSIESRNFCFLLCQDFIKQHNFEAVVKC